MTTRLGMLACVCIAALGCDDFLQLDELRCGNGVIEPRADEECDGLPPGLPFRCGTPGTAAACRLVCTDDVPCPSGWGCGRDGICRASGGGLTSPVVTRLDGASLHLADMDGDGRLDAVTDQRGAIGVGYGVSDGAFVVVPSHPAPPPRTRMGVGDVDGDGRADVLLPLQSGLGVVRGRRDRTLESMPAPSLTAEPVDALLAVSTGSPAAAELIVALRAVDGRLEVEVEGYAVELSPAVAAIELADSLQAVVGQLDPPGAPSTEEIVLRVAGSPIVTVLDIRCDATCAIDVAAALPLPDGLRTTGFGASVADMDLDGWPDVVVQANTAELPVLIARGGAEGLGPLVVQPELTTIAPRRVPDPIVNMLRSVEDVVGDRRPDLFAPAGIFVVTGPLDAPAADVAWLPRPPLVNMRVTDLDGDGRADVVGRGRDTLEVGYVRDGDVFVQRGFDSDPVDLVEVADLNGDGRADVLTVVRDGRIEVRSGRADGDLSAPAILGRFDLPVRWAVARVGDALGTDGIDDLVLQSSTRRYVFRGDASGRPVAPLTFETAPRSATVGRFDGEPPTTFVLLSDQTEVRLDFDVDSGTLQSAPLSPTTVLDRPGALEVLGHAVTLDDGFERYARLDWLDFSGDAATALIVGRVDGEIVHYDTAQRIDAAYEHRALAFADVDGDGWTDAVALMLPPPPRAVDDPRRYMAIWLGAVGGDFGPGTTHALPDFTEEAVALRLGEQSTLLIVVDGAFRRVALVDGALDMQPIAQADLAVRDGAAADMDGDGLDDVVLKTDSSVLVYLQSRCGARAARDGACLRSAAW